MSELDHRMSSREFMEWMVYSQIEPFGPVRQDYHASLISTVIANSTGNKMKPDDFIRPFKYEKKTTTAPDEYTPQQQQMMALFQGLSGA